MKVYSTVIIRNYGLEQVQMKLKESLDDAAIKGWSLEQAMYTPDGIMLSIAWIRNNAY